MREKKGWQTRTTLNLVDDDAWFFSRAGRNGENFTRFAKKKMKSRIAP